MIDLSGFSERHVRVALKRAVREEGALHDGGPVTAWLQIPDG